MFEWSWPPSASPILLNHCLQVPMIKGLYTHSIMASKFFSLFTPSWALSASRNSPYHSFQVHVSVPSISASQWITKLSLLQPQSESVIPRYPGLQVHFKTRSITESKCISNSIWSAPPSASLSSLNGHLQVLLRLPSRTRVQRDCLYVYN